MEYPAFDKKDWFHLVQELPSKTRYWRRDRGTGFSIMQIVWYSYRTVALRHGHCLVCHECVRADNMSLLVSAYLSCEDGKLSEGLVFSGRRWQNGVEFFFFLGGEVTAVSHAFHFTSICRRCWVCRSSIFSFDLSCFTLTLIIISDVLNQVRPVVFNL
jgi:hypothetical protein